MRKKTKTTIDDLARMVADGFANTATKSDIQGLSTRMDFLEIGQEDIKLRLDNAAYKFEMKELEHRVEVLEDKTGVVRK